MKYVKLTNSRKRAIVSDKDYEFISQWNWQYHNDGYAVRYKRMGLREFNKRVNSLITE